ncbi:MAG: OmpA family protein [bacterium]
MRRLLSAALALLMSAQMGCSAASRPDWLHEAGWNKPWTHRAGIAAAVCAVVGAGAGVGVQEARRGCSTVTVGGSKFESCDSLSDSNDDTFWVWGALIGAASGALVCGILGHVFLDPPAEAEIPPPPPPPLAQAAPAPPIKQRIVLRGVQFDFNKSDIRPDARPVLDQAAAILKQNPAVQVVVQGYTDDIGTPQYNDALSLRRAEAVFRYLVNQGVSPERFKVQGFGESNPVADNATESGRAQNRRVELRVRE